MNVNELTHAIIGAAIEVHRALGPGLLESAYQRCLERELDLQKIPFQPQLSLPLRYKGMELDCGYRLDFLVANLVVVEIKSVECLDPIHEAQILTYLALAAGKSACSSTSMFLSSGMASNAESLDLKNRQGCFFFSALSAPLR